MSISCDHPDQQDKKLPVSETSVGRSQEGRATDRRPSDASNLDTRIHDQALQILGKAVQELERESWYRTIVPLPLAVEGMTHTVQRAYECHAERYGKMSSFKHLLEWSELQSSLMNIPGRSVPSLPISCLPCFPFAHRGKHRTAMEDTHFFQESSEKFLAGVFDGHGYDRKGINNEVAQQASKFFQEHFFTYLLQNGGDVRRTWLQLFYEEEKEICSSIHLRCQGSTAVVAYFDGADGVLYLATLGDSEAVLYRRDLQRAWKLIPLSPLVNWSTPEEEKRAQEAIGDSSFLVDVWRTQGLHSGRRRYPRQKLGINVSRTLGDAAFKGHAPHGRGISAEPLLSSIAVQPGDLLVMATDGLMNFSTVEQRLECVASCASPSSALASKLGEMALRNMTEERGDNITILALVFVNDR